MLLAETFVRIIFLPYGPSRNDFYLASWRDAVATVRSLIIFMFSFLLCGAFMRINAM
jgi:hypothetical protein